MSPLDLAQALLSLPTAPYREMLPAGFCRQIADDLGLEHGQDAAGNTVVRTGPGPSPLVLVAHLDHPGFSVTSERDGDGRLRLDFVGGVALDAARPGTPVDFFLPGLEGAVGQGRLLEAIGEGGRLQGGWFELVDGEAPEGGFAMWAFPGWSVEDGLITARVCDDLLGVAAVLACLEQVGDEIAMPIWGLFTRAEEDGLLGAFEAVRLGVLPPDAVVLSLECSKALPEAPQGSGVIVRVGDRLTTFDDALTSTVRATAEAAGVTHRRKLMDGGVCEASVFCNAGYRASGLAVPLGNYHNAADDGSGIAPETVRVGDWLAEIDLLCALATQPMPVPGPPPWFEERSERARVALGAAHVPSAPSFVAADAPAFVAADAPAFAAADTPTPADPYA
ncbi:MAG TPA: M20/M25/M40 family metallo-hydrolase [Acidimicrobiales bacterium]